MPYPSPGLVYCGDACREAVTRDDRKARYLVDRERMNAHKTAIGCSHCGYDKCGAALDWHHPNGDKERRLSVNTYFTSLGEQERAKCVLLCANCHREEHAGASV